MIHTSLNHCKEMGAEPGRRFLKQPAAKLEPVIATFGLSTFITSQSMFIPMNTVLKRYLACPTFSKCQPYSNESCLSIRTYTYKIKADNQLHNCVCGALSIKDGGVINIPAVLAKSLWRRTIELQLL